MELFLGSGAIPSGPVAALLLEAGRGHERRSRANQDGPSPELEKGTIGQMEVGDARYTIPWAMDVDTQGQYWLPPDCPVFNQSGGTFQMRVERRADGYHAWRVPGRTYKPLDRRLKADPGSIPVVQLHRQPPRGLVFSPQNPPR